MQKLDFHAGLTLYEEPSKFYIQPRDESNEALVIDRQTGGIAVDSVDRLPYNTQSQFIHGIVGIKHLISGSYLIVITKASLVGCLGGNTIFKLEDTRIIPFAPDANLPGHANKQSSEWEHTYLKMLETILKEPSFYFSYNYDLTNSLQRSHAIADALANSSVQSNAYILRDKRFTWNDHLLADLDESNPKLLRYRMPLVLGFVSVNENALGHGLNWILISRRSTRRAGTRFHRRGIDSEGDVANFVETEQIIERGDTIASFVQIRGSIPLFWSQKPGYRYKPAIVIHQEDHEAAMNKHLSELNRIYGDLSIACLIDQRGHEGNLAHEFSQRISQIQKYYNVAYHYFDFHKECSNMRWYRLNTLLERIEPEIKNHGYFAIRDGKFVCKQTGVIRSNCIDSLDRTNVIQSMIAQTVLQSQLGLFGANVSALKLSDYPIFMETFKNVWADNADALSIQYAGTPALKTDFTRTGQRTHAGMLRDGLNSLTRYVSNNYLDGYRQDAIDLFLGKYGGYPSPSYRPLDMTSYTSMVPVTVVMITLVALYLYFRWDPVR